MKIRPAHLPSRVTCFGLLFCLAAASIPAHAQWVWRDATGNTNYSDSPPPPDVRPEAILRRPAQSLPSSAGPSYDTGEAQGGAAPNANPSGQRAPAAQAPNAPKSLAEQDAEFRKRRDERIKAEQKAAEDQAKAQQRMEACNQAKGYLDMLQSGMRLMRPNPDGTRGYADDATRSAEIQKAQDSVASNCQ